MSNIAYGNSSIKHTPPHDTTYSEPHHYEDLTKYQEMKYEEVSSSYPLPQNYEEPVTTLSQSGSKENSFGPKLPLRQSKTYQETGDEYDTVVAHFQSPKQNDGHANEAAANGHSVLSEGMNRADVETQLNISYSTSHMNGRGNLEVGRATQPENNYEYLDTPANIPGESNDMYTYIPTVVRVGTRRIASENGMKSNTLAAIMDDGEYI